MTVSQRSSVESRKKAKEGDHVKTIVAGMDMPFVTPRAGGYVNIPKSPPAAIGSSMLASASKIGVDDFDPNCVCKSAICHDSQKKIPTVTIKSPENSIAGMQSFGLTGTETTREFRIQKALSIQHNVPSLGNIAESDEDFPTDSEPQPAVNMLALLISTVMLLASDSAVPGEVLYAVESYLRCIRDDDDNTPPNVQGLLNYICLLKGESRMEHTTEEDFEKAINEKEGRVSVLTADVE